MRIIYLLLSIVALATVPTESFSLPGIQSIFDSLSKRIKGQTQDHGETVLDSSQIPHSRRKRNVPDENTRDAHIAESSE